jgi:hypothetical protein
LIKRRGIEFRFPNGIARLIGDWADRWLKKRTLLAAGPGIEHHYFSLAKRYVFHGSGAKLHLKNSLPRPGLELSNFQRGNLIVSEDRLEPVKL